MKDIIITPAHVKRELTWAISMLAVACLMNVGAIIGYDAPWSELYTQWHVMLALGGVLLCLSWVARSVAWLVRRGLSKI